MSPPRRPCRRVQAWPCQGICRWEATSEVWLDLENGDLALFRCVGCGSEWVRTEGWTPVDATCNVPPDIEAERERGKAAGACGLPSDENA